MLKLLVILSTTLVIAMATSDPSADWCWEQCRDWHKKEIECITNTCAPEIDDEDCVNTCFKIGEPCHVNCQNTYATCDSQCPVSEGASYDDSCFETCFEEKFDPEQPLPVEEDSLPVVDETQ